MTTGPALGRHRDASSRANAAANDEAASTRSVIEIIAVIMLGIATVATAWCGFQSSKWNQRETDEARTAGLTRLEASRLYGLATQKVSYDASVTTQYAAAIASDDTELAAFIREHLVRPEYLPFLDEWQAQLQSDSGEGSNLFTNEEYIAQLLAPSQEADAESDAALARSGEASDNAADYLVMTLLTATALFFAGVTSSFSSRSAKTMLVIVSASILVFTLAELTTLPTV